MSEFLSRWHLHLIWITFTLSLINMASGAQEYYNCRRGTTVLQADAMLRLLSFPRDRSTKYPPNFVCTWQITANHGVVKLNILELDIEKSQAGDCRFDSLKIYNDYSFTKVQLAKLCGDLGSENHTIISTSNSVLLNFSSDRSNERNGFRLSYINVPVTDTDEQRQISVIKLNATGADRYLTYPLFGNYPKNADVQWRITSPNSVQKVNVYIETLAIESGSNCMYDALTIHDGYDSQAPVLAKLCGSLDFSNRKFRSSSRYLFLRFTSDQGFQRSGFKIRYTTKESTGTGVSCPSNQNLVNNLFASNIKRYLTYSNLLQSSQRGCTVEWRIRSSREIVRFEVEALTTDRQSNCDVNALTFYDGYDDSAAILQTLCGYPSEQGLIFVSSSHEVFVRFMPDRLDYQEFRISFRAEDSPETGASGGTDRSGYIAGTIGGVCLVLIVIGLVAFMIIRKMNEQRRRRSRRHPNGMSLANSNTMNGTSGSQSTSVYVVGPSAPPPYATLNQAYVHEEAPPSYSEANKYIVDPRPPPLYSNAIVGNVTAGQTSPATLSGADVMVAFKKDDEHIYANASAHGSNGQNQGTSLSQVSSSVQESHDDYEHRPNDDRPAGHLGQEHYQ